MCTNGNIIWDNAVILNLMVGIRFKVFIIFLQWNIDEYFTNLTSFWFIALLIETILANAIFPVKSYLQTDISSRVSLSLSLFVHFSVLPATILRFLGTVHESTAYSVCISMFASLDLLVPSSCRLMHENVFRVVFAYVRCRDSLARHVLYHSSALYVVKYEYFMRRAWASFYKDC